MGRDNMNDFQLADSAATGSADCAPANGVSKEKEK